jgi:hypothetical protein
MVNINEVKCKCGHGYLEHNRFMGDDKKGEFGCIHCDCPNFSDAGLGLHVIFTAGTPHEKEDDEGSFYIEHEVTRGVNILSSWEQFDQWSEDMSVSFGEQGGYFHILGGWIGDYEGLAKGLVVFQSAQELDRGLQAHKDYVAESHEMPLYCPSCFEQYSGAHQCKRGASQ